MITIGVINVPEEAKYWIPIFYLDDEEIYPDYLLVTAHWGTSKIGPSHADLSIGLFDKDKNNIGWRSVGFTDWLDATAYIYDWEAGKLEVEGEAKGFPWLLAGAGVLAAAMLIVIPARRK